MAESLARWQANGSMTKLCGLNIFTRSGGQGPVLLLIHGFPTASWDWAKLWPALTRHFRVLTLDLAGFGFSDKPRDLEYSMHLQADLCEALMEQERVHEYSILAHDYGVTVAQELLARHLEGSAKQSLNKVCFLNGGLFPETHRALLTQKLLLGPLGPVIARLSSRRKLTTTLQNICMGHLSQEELDGAWALIEHKQGRRVFPKLIRYIEERRQHRSRWVGALQNSDIPLRVIVGMDDPISGAHMLARYRELVPKADGIALEGIGHYPQLEAPAEVLRAVTAFLR